MPIDKLLHLLVGYLISDLAFEITSDIALTVSLSILVAAGKGVHDYFNRDSHTPELADFLVTVLGAVVALCFNLSL